MNAEGPVPAFIADLQFLRFRRVGALATPVR